MKPLWVLINILISTVILSLFLTSCGAKDIVSREPVNKWTVTDGITLYLEQDEYPVGIEKMSLVLENRSDNVMLYGQGWSFEKYEENEWKILASKENYGFTMEGYTLYDNDKMIFPIYTTYLKDKLDEGLYRVTGCSLRVASDDRNLSYGMDYVDYPEYQLEFIVSKDAPEPVKIEEANLHGWDLPIKEDWQWYTPWECENMYERVGMSMQRIVQGKNGLIAILYHDGSSESKSQSIGDKLMLDLFDRKTGKHFKVFDSPTVETQWVTADETSGIRIHTEQDEYYANIIDSKLLLEE